MDWKAQRPAIEIAAELIATVAVGGAIGFATWALAPLGTGVVALSAASIAGVAGTITAWWVMGRVDREQPASGDRFVPVDYDETADVLLLDEPIDDAEALLLEAPSSTARANSRVVQLFAAPATADEAERPESRGEAMLPAPGEMVATIENFLGGARNSGGADDQSRPAAADASAALHAALADIRRSLRQG